MPAEPARELAGISPAGLREQAAELRERLLAATARVLDSGWYVLGREVEGFEREFAAWTGAAHAVGVASGSDALELALRACGVAAGDEVIVPANALPTAFGVAASGARVRFADVRAEDLQIDPADVAGLIGPRTRAVVAVHLYGHPADLGALGAVLDRSSVAVIEDCAQAHGASAGGTPVGLTGDAAAWSFYPTKNLGAYGDGGAVTTADPELAARVRRLRAYGEQERYLSVEYGVNSRLDELQAAFLREKLTHLDGWIAARRRVAAIYDELLADCGVVRPPLLAGVEHARHLYPVQVPDRDRVFARLRDQGLPVAIHYPRGAHQQPCFSDRWERPLPVTEQLARSLLSLPMHSYLADDDARRIAAAVAAAVRRA